MESSSVRYTTLAQRAPITAQRTADVCAAIRNFDIERLRVLDGRGLLRGYTEGIVQFTDSVIGDDYGTPLLACIADHGFRNNHGDAGVVEVVRMLVGNGANLAARSYEDESDVLELAAREGTPELVTFLLDIGLPVDGINGRGESALGYTRRLDVAQLLVQRGATVTHRDRKGQTPMHEAAYHGREHIVQYLIECNAEVNAFDNHNETPLFEAVNGRNPAAASVLLANGADINVVCRRDFVYQQLDILGVASIYPGHPNPCLQPIREEMRRRAEVIRAKRSEAFVMGLHDRLGGGSRVHGLEENLVQMIQDIADIVLADPAVLTT